MRYNRTKLLAFLCAPALFLTGCIEENFPTLTVTEDQVEDAPKGAQALIESEVAWMTNFNTLERAAGDERHFDFGYPAICVMNEMLGQDVVPLPSNYDQFWIWHEVNGAALGPEYIYVAMPWRFFYRLIFLSKYVIGMHDPATATEQELTALGQAYAYRAFAYFNLVQMYQYTYVGHQNEPAVPIVTEKTTQEESENNPRASVEAVYTLITGDLTKAIEYLENYDRSYSARHYIDAQVAHGLAARVYLTMENWGEARQHAAAAKAGYSPMTEAQFLDETNGFNNMYSQNSWIWGIDLTTDDDVVRTGLVNWTANMCNETVFGYIMMDGDPVKMIDASLYEQINPSDWRKKTWTDEETPSRYYAYYGLMLPKYASRKFQAANGDGLSSAGAAADFPLMRVEEMMLIEAEAAGMQNLAEGKTLLEDLVKTRNASYTCTAASQQDFRDEVWLQRRIELWGEGFSYFDLKRLNKPVTRSYPGTNHYEGSRYNSVGVPYWFNYTISRSEVISNKGIPQSANNPTPSTPDDIDPDGL